MAIQFNNQQQVAANSFNKALQIAQAFAKLSMKSAQLSNINKVKAAKANIKAGTAQIEAQESDQKAKIARALARHQGTLKVNAAFRGSLGAASTTAGATSATIEAGREAANVSANAANAIQRLVSENNPQLTDVKLAGLEGALQGFSVGSQLAGALASLGSSYTTPIKGGGDPKYGGSPITGGDTVFTIPGLDLASIFGGGGGGNTNSPNLQSLWGQT